MIADCAHLLHTPLGELMRMEWDEVERWHQEAVRIARALAGKDE